MKAWRTLLAPSLASFVVLIALVGLGSWQLQRRSWKEGLIAHIEARARGEPGAIAAETSWPAFAPGDDEFRRVRVVGTFLHAHEALVHGLLSGERGVPAQGFYVFTPLRLPDGALVFVNRGFVPTELRQAASRPQSHPLGEVTVAGIVRAPEDRRWFTPSDVPAEHRFFTRDPLAMARVHGLERVAPFYVEADATLNPDEWPRSGPKRLEIANNHLPYALTWFGLAIALAAVFAAFASRRLHPEGRPSSASPSRSARRSRTRTSP